MPSRRTVLLSAGGLVATGTTLTVLSRCGGADNEPAAPRALPLPDVSDLQNHFQFEELSNPDRTIVRHPDGAKAAELTHGSRTVLLSGKERTFTEPRATRARVVTKARVRIAPEAYDPIVLSDPQFAAWLLERIRSPGDDDVLGVACQYVTGSADQRDARGVRYAGDAAFGYINNESTRDGADFYDYLGVPWTWPDGTVSRPAAKWSGALDCSGYIRLVFGYRMGMLLHRTNRRVDNGLPRTAYAMAERAPSTVVAEPDQPDQAPADLTQVAPGDVAFFALHDTDPALITHSGIVLGNDTDGGLRFVSSRQTINGPTFGDLAGNGVIDTGYFGDRLRRVIRL
jgi:cell wall-associated NlpC family hydrolase